MGRPFLNFRIPELETELAERRGDIEFLEALVDELGYRSTERARRLKELALQALAESRLAPPADAKPMAPSAGPPQNPPDPIRPSGDGGPAAILDAWTTLEVLSPQTFRRPEDLASGDRKAVASLDGERLPWEGGGEKPRPKTKLFYQIVLGTVDFGAAVSRLLAVYEDTRAERPAARGEAVLAIVVVDRRGCLVETPAAALSSFAWGTPRALRGEISALADWPAAERELVEELDEVLRPDKVGNEESEEEPALDRATLSAAYGWLISRLGLPPDLVSPPRFAIRSYESYKSLNPPEPLLLNSFFLADLGLARSLFTAGRSTPNLRRYLGIEAPAQRSDLLRDGSTLEAAVAPRRIPPARWPGAGRHPLVLLQQAAVNLALGEIENSGILAVNGPPGTGKTTLLRDLVAAIVTARAEAMASFDDPVQAFAHSGEKLKAGSAWLHLYRLNPKLKGFEMLVASSNNKAVENVSAELPERKNIAEDLHDEMHYFRTLSNAMRERETWGLIAAILGNSCEPKPLQENLLVGRGPWVLHLSC